jgi:membrane protease YdiL (CAAX protease family)
MKNKKRTLLISSFILLPFTFVLLQITTFTLGPKWGYVTGFLGYWVYCLFIAWLMAGSNWNYLKGMWNQQRENKYAGLIAFSAFIPAFGVFFVAFLPNAAKLTLSTSVLLVFMAVLNGAIEEFYWRGLYLLEYHDNARIGFFLSTLLFGAWHFSVWSSRGVIYKDGIIALIGGAYVMGLLWTWVARSQGNIRAVVPAHILVNFFAFTALFVDNSF